SPPPSSSMRRVRKRACFFSSYPPLRFFLLFGGLWLFDTFERRFAAAAETSPVRGFRHDALIRTDGRVLDRRLGRANRRAAIVHMTRGFDHQAPERNHRDVAGADPLLGAIADRAHPLPH